MLYKQTGRLRVKGAGVFERYFRVLEFSKHLCLEGTEQLNTSASW